MTQFWGGIWGTDDTHNVNANWLEFCKVNPCKDAKLLPYEINCDIFDVIIKKVRNNKALGRDLIVDYWIKRLMSTHDHLMSLYVKLLINEIDLPNWLTLTVTNMLPKNNDTNDPQNYRPITCENNMLTIYTAIIAQIVDEHCVKNNVITLNQAGGKSGSWGYIDQLLINKMITEEVITNRRNLMSI